MPSEHGGWSLTLEPVLLGLIVEWSAAGLALGIAAVVAFVARTPIKIVLVDRWRDRWLPRTRLAALIGLAELAVLAALVTYAATASEAGFWVPLAFAAPLIALEMWYDMRSRSRRLVPELAGAIGIGSIASAIAMAGGSSDEVAVGLWVVLAARSVAAIPYVRTQILRTKSQPATRWHSDVAQLVAVIVVVGGWVADLVPGPAVIAIVVLGAVDVAAVRQAPRRAVVIGAQQTILGIVVIATTAAAVLAA